MGVATTTSSGSKRSGSRRGGTPVATKARNDIIFRGKAINKMFDKLWSNAGRAPMFCKLVGKNKKGDEMRRATRLVSGHAHQIMASGSAQVIAREQQLECQALGLEFKSSVNGPPITQAQVTAGYCSFMDQVACAYEQHILWASRLILATSITKHKRLNRDVIKLAAAEANASTFKNGGLAPRAVYVVPLPKSKTGKKADADFVPPSAAQQQADENQDEAVVAAAEGEE